MDYLVGQVRLHLLTAVLKCFLKRPPETQKALGAALAAGLADFHQDVHDRALFYYRLLQYNVSVAERVVNPPKQAVSVFADTQSSEVKDRIFDEFNSLSVVYQKLPPASNVISSIITSHLSAQLVMEFPYKSCVTCAKERRNQQIICSFTAPWQPCFGSLFLLFWCSVGGVIFSQGCILSWPCAFVGKKSKEGMESSSFVLILDLIKGEKSESL
ncbi:Beta-adaptin-like protein A [Vitis vinifera]|uniref:Beta-adaptin-like protein A n=1 Tax=Vitis vinifera TaxID=29760 RepID=A0A438K8U3_VITVI|nr:Beta-adaptin-like protein A [Vitis vinifera]